MQKLTNPISIFVLIVLGLLLMLLKIKISLFLNVGSSFIFAAGVFFVSFALGLLFLNYLTSESPEIKVETVSNKKEDVKKQKTDKAKIVSSNGIKFSQKLKNEPNNKLELKENGKITQPKIENKDKPKKDIKINKAFLASSINKKDILKLLNDLQEKLNTEKKNYQKINSNGKILSFFATVVILVSLVFLALKYAFLTPYIIVIVILLIILLGFIVLRYKKIQKESGLKLKKLSERLVNLNRTTKRFKSISSRNFDALKSTIDSLSSEDKEYIYKKIKK